MPEGLDFELDIDGISGHQYNVPNPFYLPPRFGTMVMRVHGGNKAGTRELDKED